MLESQTEPAVAVRACGDAINLAAVSADVEAARGAVAGAGAAAHAAPRAHVAKVPRARLGHVAPEDRLAPPGGLGMVKGLEHGGADALADGRDAESGAAVEARHRLPLLLEEHGRAGGKEAVAIVVDQRSLQEVGGPVSFVCASEHSRLIGS